MEIAILITGAVKGCYKKKYIPFYTAGFLVMTALMIYLTVFKGFMFQLTYINAFIGEIFWFALVYKKDYPAKPINLAAFVAKFIADVAAVPVYISSGAWYMHVVCVLLPIFDFCFLVLYFKKKKKARNKLTKL